MDYFLKRVHAGEKIFVVCSSNKYAHKRSVCFRHFIQNDVLASDFTPTNSKRNEC